MDVSRVKFKEIKDKGIVIAQIDDVQYDAMEKLNKNFISTVTSKIYVGVCLDRTKEYMMPYSMKAIARCAPEDTYDFEVGKKIAIKKLTEKYEKSVNKRMARFLVDMNEALSNMDEYFANRTF